jgi:hypothetical protein
MKKVVLLLALASLSVVGMQSCKKEENEKPAIQQTINVELKANESYSFVLPKNKRDDAYEFTTKASHSSISELGVDANGNRVYKYTPAQDYFGTDKVVVSNDQEREEHHKEPKGTRPPFGGKPHGHGDCKGGEEDHYIVTINFIVNSEEKTE